MYVWEYVLQADKDRDLTDLGQVVEWLAEAKTFSHVGEFDEGAIERLGEKWPVALAAMWVKNVNALRSIAARLKNKKARRSTIAALEADEVFHERIRMLRPAILWNVPDDAIRPAKREDVTPKSVADLGGTVGRYLRDVTIPLDSSNFVGIRLLPDLAHSAVTLLPQFDIRWAGPAVALDVLWQIVFGSMVDDYFQTVCAKCGVPLGLTPKGRRPRAGLCKSCANKQWLRNQPKEKLRERWKANKAAERAKLKGE